LVVFHHISGQIYLIDYFFPAELKLFCCGFCMTWLTEFARPVAQQPGCGVARCWSAAAASAAGNTELHWAASVMPAEPGNIFQSTDNYISQKSRHSNSIRGTEVNKWSKQHFNLALSLVHLGFMTHLHSLPFIERHLSYLGGAGVSPWCCTAIGWAGVGLVFSCLHAHWMDDQSIKLCNRIPEKKYPQTNNLERGLCLILFVKC